ncbi:MAG: chemotaxis protein CheC [Thermodesulfobacteriota bacterium]|nr:chemotaxis protein CheC [Thermodesulfobacteriota bacterium]
MASISIDTLSRDEEEILEEVMNIAFGSASADLGEVIDIRVSLNVPEVRVADIQTITDHFQRFSRDNKDIKIIQQNFWGDFAGRSFLLVSGTAGNDLVCLADEGVSDNDPAACGEMRHNGVLLEIGNILIGACIAKIGELLSTIVTYSPPVLADRNKPFAALVGDFCDAARQTIIIKTTFSFDDRSTNGLLLTVARPESITWMKAALAAFMEDYE